MNKTLQKQIIRIVCLLLTLALSLGCFAACKGSETAKKKKKKKTSSKAETSTSESYLSEGDEDSLFDGEWDDEEPIEDDEPIEEEPAQEFEGVEDTITVKNGSEPLLTNYLGLNGIYMCYPYIKNDLGRQYTEDQASIELERVKNMKLNNVRTNYGSEFAYENGAFNWESVNMQGIYRWAKVLQEADVDIALNASWAVEVMYADTNPWNGFSMPGVWVKGDWETTLRNYQNWMVQSLAAFRAHGINNIEYLIMFTEPEEFPRHQVLPDQKLEDLEDPVFEKWFEATKACHEALVEAGVRSMYKMVGPNSTGTTYTAEGIYVNPLFSQAVRYANDFIDIYSNHTYLRSVEDPSQDTMADLVDPAWRDHATYAKERTGKECWADEYNLTFGSGSEHGITEARESPWFAMHHGVVLATAISCGVQNQVMWTIADQQWNNNANNDDGFHNGIQKHGVLPSLFESTFPKTSYYGVSLLTRYFGNHANAYETDSGAIYSAYQVDENNVASVLAVNMDPVEKAKVTVEFEKNIGHTVFYRHLYDTNNQVSTAEAKLIGIDKVIHCYGDTFTDTIPSGSMAVYTTTKD